MLNQFSLLSDLTEEEESNLHNKDTKKRKRESSEEERQRVSLSILGQGAKPALEIKQQRDKPIKVRDMRELVLWLLGDGVSTKWIYFTNKTLYSKVVIVLLCNVDCAMFDAHETSMPFLAQVAERIQCEAPGSANRIYPVLQALLLCPVTKKVRDELKKKQELEKNKLVKKQKKKLKGRKKQKLEGGAKPEETKEEEDKKEEQKTLEDPRWPINSFVLTQQQLLNNDFPVMDNITEETRDQWIVFKEGQPRGKLISIDCEMCSTKLGLELTRVSCVDENGKVLYDKLVMPANPILDYLTRYSGITPALMQGVKTTLTDVQRELQEFIYQDTILIGHSLENDLQALRVVHKKVIDTSILYPHPSGKGNKQALRHLCAKYLKVAIQQETHDSIQDSTAALELVKLKLLHGPDFGLDSSENENLFVRLDSSQTRSVMIDNAQNLSLYAKAGTVSAISCATDEEVFDNTVKAVRRNEKFVCAQFHSLSKLEPEDPQCETKLKKTDQFLSSIYQALPENALFIVMAGGREPLFVKRLTEEKSERQRDPTGWTESDESQLQQKIGKGRMGISFLQVKVSEPQSR